MYFSGLKMTIQLVFSCFPGVLIQHPSDHLFPCRKTRKKYFLYDLSFTLYADANEPLYNRIYIRGRTEMIYGRMGRKDFRPLAFESLLALTCGKKMSQSDPLRCCFVRYAARWFYSLMGSTYVAR